jgi:hypothetical protein
MPDPAAERPARVPLRVVQPRRPEPPDDLSEREADLWRAIVAARPVTWINNAGAAFTLRLYVQAAIIGEDLSRRASRDRAFIGKLNRQTNIVLRLGKELGLLPIRPRTSRPRLVRSPHSTPPWSA